MRLIPWSKKQNIPISRVSAPPTDQLSDLRRELDGLFDRFLRTPWIASAADAEFLPEFTPEIDVSENHKRITIRAEVPGMAADDIDISLSGNTLVLHGEKREVTEDEADDHYHCERRFGSFTRKIELPTTANLDEIDAEQRNGVLTIHVAKLPNAASKRIEVNAGRGELTGA